MARKGLSEAKRQRAEKALDLRIAGASYRQIAKHLGINEKTAFYDVQNALGEIDKARHIKAERLLELELAAVDRVLLGLSQEAFRGHPRSAEVWIKARERRAKLLGIDAPTKTEGSGASEVPVKFTIALSKPPTLGLPPAEPPPFTIDVGGNGHHRNGSGHA